MASVALIALILDALIGWPGWLFRRIGHPVTWLGRLIGALDARMNRGGWRRVKGGVAVALVIAAAVLPALILQAVLGPWAAAVLAWPLVAARSLDDHLRAVASPLLAQDIAGARRAVAMIVGAISPFLEGMPPIVALAAVYVLASILTEAVTNSAVAVVVTPLAIGLAAQIGVDPRPFVVAVMFGASASFATPIGYQTNTLVYGAGNYKFMDFIKIGLPMNIIVGAAAVLTIPVFFPF